MPPEDWQSQWQQRYAAAVAAAAAAENTSGNSGDSGGGGGNVTFLTAGGPDGTAAHTPGFGACTTVHHSVI